MIVQVLHLYRVSTQDGVNWKGYISEGWNTNDLPVIFPQLYFNKHNSFR